MGGEKIRVSCYDVVPGGSPPRGRGKAAALLSAPSGRRDHPRVGGEKRPSSQGRRVLRGSPPRGRGKVTFLLFCDFACRITPAWAGKRRCAAAALLHPRDHPRVGGEKMLLMMLSEKDRGSPPRGRGKAPQLVIRRRLSRITPAWAGKSRICHKRIRRVKDHPRVGGEKGLPSFKVCRPQGSPPRGRGKDIDWFSFN